MAKLNGIGASMYTLEVNEYLVDVDVELQALLA